MISLIITCGMSSNVFTSAAGKRNLNSPNSENCPADSSNRWTLLICFLLTLATWLVFGQTLNHGFVNYDDELYITNNPEVLGGVSVHGVIGAFIHYVNFNWTPLAVITHMLDCQFYGTKAGWHHFTNVLLHNASAIALFLVLKRMTAALWRSAFVAALFAVHPLHVESVAWIAERRDVLSGLFFMLTLGVYAGYARKPSTGRYLMVVLMLALALMCKPMLVTLPFVLLLLDYWPLKRLVPTVAQPVPWRIFVEKLPLLAVSGADCVITLFAQKEAIQPLPLSQRIANALISCVVYLKQTVYPTGLAVYYPFPGNSLALWKILAAFVLLTVISVVAIALRRKYPWFLVGWLWYLGMLVPAIGLIQSGLRAHADRYTYLPQIGPCLLLTWAAAVLCARLPYRRIISGGLAAVILIALIGCARNQVRYWKSDVTLWTHALACAPDNALAEDYLGNALCQEGEVDEAIVHYQRALQLEPDNAKAHIVLANALLQKGNPDEAILWYRKALRIEPNNFEAENNLGNALLKKNRWDEAITQFDKALRIKPDYAEAWYNLGVAKSQKGNVDEAEASYRQALAIKSDYADARYNLAGVLLQRNNLNEAITQFQQDLQLEPGNVEAYNSLGVALLRKGDVDEALVQFQKALQIRPDYAKIHYDFGNGLLQKGEVNAAIIQYQIALRIEPTNVQARINLGNSLLTAGKVGQAIAQYQAALQIEPTNAIASNNLNSALQLSRSTKNEPPFQR